MISCFHKDTPPHLLAQKLNNGAACCIETGLYDKAVLKLVKALKLTEQLDNTVSCTCQFCSLEECVTFSQKSPGRNRCDYSFDNDSSLLSCEEESEGGYVYRQPIRITPQTMVEGHSMGLVLPKILIFNLALVHHLSLLEKKKMSRKKLTKVLQLYELAYRLQSEYYDDDQTPCLGFALIICNNLGEIHRMVNNRSKYARCLQHLLSTMMFMMVECREQQNYSLELDGFLRNTSSLILLSQSAAAA
jgi:hypothetical protein